MSTITSDQIDASSQVGTNPASSSLMIRSQVDSRIEDYILSSCRTYNIHNASYANHSGSAFSTPSGTDFSRMGNPGSNGSGSCWILPTSKINYIGSQIDWSKSFKIIHSFNYFFPPSHNYLILDIGQIVNSGNPPNFNVSSTCAGWYLTGSVWTSYAGSGSGTWSTGSSIVDTATVPIYTDNTYILENIPSVGVKLSVKPQNAALTVIGTSLCPSTSQTSGHASIGYISDSVGGNGTIDWIETKIINTQGLSL